MKATPLFLPARLFLPALLLTACEGSSFTPTVAFDRLDVLDLTWSDIESDFVFKVNNPNPIDISLAAFDYELAFADVEWLAGDDPDGLTLAADGTSDLALPMHIVFQDLYNVAQAIGGEDTIPFNIKGTFGFDTPLGRVNLPYDADGAFPALRAPKVGFQRVRVENLDFTSADLAIDLGLDHDHGSNLIFNNFDYDIDLSGRDIATGLIDNLAEARAGETTDVSLPVGIDLLQAGTAVFDIITGSSTTMDLRASTDIDTPFGILPLSIDETGNVNIE